MDSERRLTPLCNRRGIALVHVALFMAALIAVIGLAVDAGHLFVVRGQLQNAADAAAMAGAWSLYHDPAPAGTLPALDWERARAAASDFITRNRSEGVLLETGTVEVGYWPPLDPAAPLSTLSSGPSQIPAVRVTVARDADSNGGPVLTSFMQFFGASNRRVPVSSRPAVATSGFLGGAAPNTLFPLAISKCMTDSIFSRPPAEWPARISINSAYAPGGSTCFTGQWTSFFSDNNDVPTISGLIKNGNPTPIGTGDSIWIEPGAKASLYQADKWDPPLPASGRDVILAVVDTGGSDLGSKGEKTITGFATFHIDGATPATKQVFGHFIAYSTTYPAGGTPGGPASNTVSPPRMVQ